MICKESKDKSDNESMHKLDQIAMTLSSGTKGQGKDELQSTLVFTAQVLELERVAVVMGNGGGGGGW